MKKKLTIFLVILVIIALVGTVEYLEYKKNKPIDPFELEWVRIYYSYMRENHENLKVNQNGLKYFRENEKIEFCEVEDVKNPIMLYNYKELGVTFTNIFYIANDNSVKMLKSFKKDFNVVYLYDVEEQKYKDYAEEIYNDRINYTNISESIKTNEEQKSQETENKNNILTFGINEKESVTTLDGQVLEISKFDQKFVRTTVVEDNWKDINFDNYEDAIKKDFSVAVMNMEKMLTDEVKEKVDEKRAEIQDKKEQMKRAIEEIEQKKREEEERRIAEEEARKKAEAEAKKKAEEEEKKAEEEAKKREEEQNAQNQETQGSGNTIGNYKLKYGTYKGIDYWDVNDPLSKYEITIVLKEDGTYTQTKLITVAGITEKYSGKFTLSNIQEIGTYITFSANEEAYKITADNQFTSETGAVIKYIGN